MTKSEALASLWKRHSNLLETKKVLQHNELAIQVIRIELALVEDSIDLVNRIHSLD